MHQQHETTRAGHAQLSPGEQRLPHRQYSPAGADPHAGGRYLRNGHLQRLPGHALVLSLAPVRGARQSGQQLQLSARRGGAEGTLADRPFRQQHGRRHPGCNPSVSQRSRHEFPDHAHVRGGRAQRPDHEQGELRRELGQHVLGAEFHGRLELSGPDDDPYTKIPPLFMKSAFGHYTIGIQAATDGSSNTIFAAEVLKGELYDVRGLIWSTIPGGGSFFSRMPPNSPIDYYTMANGAGAAIFGDFLNQPIFCVSEPGMDLPCTGLAGDQPAFAGAQQAPRGPECAQRRRLGPLHQEQHQHANLAGVEYHRRRRGH